MQRCIGIRREDKSHWERRIPLTPDLIAHLSKESACRGQDLEFLIQPSATRAFSDDELRQAGGTIGEDLGPCPVILGIKEIPPEFFEPNKTYIFFAHVIKGQPHNMPMLRRILELGCTLIDYEKVTSDAGQRLIFFGRHAGIAGAVETLWALGRRMEWEGLPNPLTALRHVYEYHDLAEVREAVRQVGEQIRAGGLVEHTGPLVIGVTGYGNVARGAWEVLDLLPVAKVAPDEISALAPGANGLVASEFREEHTMAPVQPLRRQRTLPGAAPSPAMAGAAAFDLADYCRNPQAYRSQFERYIPYLTAIINCVYWDARYPRLVTKAYLRQLYSAAQPRLRVIGDISCDIGGSIECTVRSTEPDNPVYLYNPTATSDSVTAGDGDETTDGYAGSGPVIMAVDILPSELPRDASADFGRALAPFIPAIAGADYAAPFEQLELPAEIKRAVIVHRGALTPAYRYLSEYLK